MAGDEHGQGSIELVAGVAALAVVCGLIAQLLLFGSALLEAQSAARVADRADEVGMDASRAGREALAPDRRSRAVITRGADGRHTVRLRTRVLGRAVQFGVRAR